MDCAVEGTHRLFQFFSVNLYYYNLLTEKGPFSTPLTCTEIIAHMKTLKLLPWLLNSEDKSQNVQSEAVNCVSDQSECLTPDVTIAAQCFHLY